MVLEDYFSFGDPVHFRDGGRQSDMSGKKQPLGCPSCLIWARLASLPHLAFGAGPWSFYGAQNAKNGLISALRLASIYPSGPHGLFET